MAYSLTCLTPVEQSALAPVTRRPRVPPFRRVGRAQSPTSGIRSWHDGLLSPTATEAARSAYRLTLADAGYTSIDRWSAETPDSPAIVGPLQLLTTDGTQLVRDECLDLLHVNSVDTDTSDTAPIVTRRVRGADRLSPLLHELARSPAILSLVERSLGARLMPHPHADARVQVNYYGPGGDCARWHRDGMNVVLTILLTDMRPNQGGRYVLNARSGCCNVDTPPYPPDAILQRVPLHRGGQAIISRGNRLDHCVTPVAVGCRVSLAVSYYVLGVRWRDANRFLHSAYDDGLARTIRTWWNIKAPWRTDAHRRRLIN